MLLIQSVQPGCCSPESGIDHSHAQADFLSTDADRSTLDCRSAVRRNRTAQITVADVAAMTTQVRLTRLRPHSRHIKQCRIRHSKAPTTITIGKYTRSEAPFHSQSFTSRSTTQSVTSHPLQLCSYLESSHSSSDISSSGPVKTSCPRCCAQDGSRDHENRSIGSLAYMPSQRGSLVQKM